MFNNDLLKLPFASPAKLRRLSVPVRLALVEEAITFKNSEDLTNKHYTALYNHDDFSVRVGKPGKEYASDRIKYNDGHKGNNPNDMSPTIFRNNTIIARNGSFEEIFRQFVLLVPYPAALELLGYLIIRNAYALDHVKQKNGTYRYTPNQAIIEELKLRLPAEFPEPIEVFLAYLELIALNEDVKYTTLGYDISNGTGRENNLLTYANVIHILLLKDKVPDSEFLLAFVKFSGGLVRIPTGINALALSKALIYFPLLTPSVQIAV